MITQTSNYVNMPLDLRYPRYSLDAILINARSPDDRRASCGEESPGSIGQGQLLTATGGDPRESATETIPPGVSLARGHRIGDL
jgi:hypothetical protein